MSSSKKFTCKRYLLIHTGKGGGDESNQREGKRGNVYKAKSKIPT
jgi:hypothetical protein